MTQGLVFSVSGSNIEDLSTSNISLDSTAEMDTSDTNVLAQVSIPPSIVDTLSSLSISPGSNSSESVRIRFHVYSTPALFISSSLMNLSETNEINRTANTPVLSLTIGEGDVSGLSEAQLINFTFTPLEVGFIKYFLQAFWYHIAQNEMFLEIQV